ncbi:MAG TPA: dolichyl-phosphate beta-glucosyltransferase [Chthoniobacteraceae bacterium]|nr:dolichyl-phosphate beta-glucosyltransferase [Chthoniobacteraceae bacterium]
MVPHLSLVIPAFDEARRLPPTIEALHAFSSSLPFACEIIIVIEKSRDNTLALARDLVRDRPAFTVIDNLVQRGKGFAVRTGMLRSRGEFIFYMDADLSVPLREVHPFLAYFDAHPATALIIGNRQHARSHIVRRQSWLRRSLGQCFNLFLRSAGLVTIHDTQCGFKAFRRSAADAIFNRARIDGFAFDVEVVLLAQRLGVAIADLPVEWTNSPASHVHIVRDSIRMVRDTLRARSYVRRLMD